MPELPEVEITRRVIEPNLLGRTVASITAGKNSYFFLTAPALLEKKLRGRTCLALGRTGKYLLAELDDHSTLLLHLGMTGQLFTTARNATRFAKSRAIGTSRPVPEHDPHTHLRISFTDGGPDVCFRDVRKFGKVKLIAPNQREPRLARLGSDALLTTGEHLFTKTRKRKAAVKTLLLNQSIVAGVGNIYADEALFISRIRPTRKAFKLSLAECDALAKAIRTVLERAITAGGSTIRDFLAPDGEAGHYQAQRLVYARGGEACKRCKTTVARVVLGGRSTHYCPSCQR